MNILTAVDAIASVALVLVCWWLAHQNSGGREPFRRVIAAGYALLAMTALAALAGRSFADLWWVEPYAEVAARVVLVVTLVAVAARLSWLYARRPDC